MARNTARFEFSGIGRLERRLAQLSGPKLKRVQDRTMSAVSRRLPTEASRLISSEILHLSTRKVRAELSVRSGEVGGDRFVELRGSNRRLPLSEYKASVRRGSGASVSVWHDAPPYQYPHAFRRKAGGRAIWQRIPYDRSQGHDGRPGGLVWRLPIVQRKGPAIRRAVLTRKHGDIFPPLMRIARDQLRAEIARLLKVEGA